MRWARCLAALLFLGPLVILGSVIVGLVLLGRFAIHLNDQEV